MHVKSQMWQVVGLLHRESAQLRPQSEGLCSPLCAMEETDRLGSSWVSGGQYRKDQGFVGV